MKLLMIGPEVTSVEEVRNFSGLWSYYLSRALRERGVELSFVAKEETCADMDLRDADHIVALGTRAFEKMDASIGEALMIRMEAKGGRVCQIHDGQTRFSPCHTTFSLKPKKHPFRDRNFNCWIGWGADPELFYPEQPNDKINILIDHGQLVGNEEKDDFSRDVWEEVRHLIKSTKQPIVVRQIVDGGLRTILNLNEHHWPRYDRKTVPLTQIAKAYRETHIFMVTHPESVGMSILETAMSGAFVLVPKGCADTLLIQGLRHMVWERGKGIGWDWVLGRLVPKTSSLAAQQFTWDRCAWRMLTYFENWKAIEGRG